jgi:hypothetical protein
MLDCPRGFRHRVFLILTLSLIGFLLQSFFVEKFEEIHDNSNLNLLID